MPEGCASAFTTRRSTGTRPPCHRRLHLRCDNLPVRSNVFEAATGSLLRCHAFTRTRRAATGLTALSTTSSTRTSASGRLLDHHEIALERQVEEWPRGNLAPTCRLQPRSSPTTGRHPHDASESSTRDRPEHQGAQSSGPAASHPAPRGPDLGRPPMWRGAGRNCPRQDT